MDLEIIDTYGNNAIIKCPHCGVPYIVSGFMDEENGRICPHCKIGPAVKWLGVHSILAARESLRSANE